MIPKALHETFKKQRYKIVGNHSAVKPCHWTRQAILNGRCCYKSRFYGVSSAQCLQMTPSVAHCSQKCVFCWRPMDFTFKSMKHWDDPKAIVDGCIQAQHTFLNGYWGVPDRIDKKILKEAYTIKNVGISLAGEPTIYPYLGGLIEEFDTRDIVTFLVSNGTFPQKLSDLSPLPTQLYISLCAPDKKTYAAACKPIIKNGWERLNETLGIFPSLSTRKVIRLTLVKGLNMKEPEKYAKLIKKANPDFVECKGYMFIGGSRQRLSIKNMPFHEDVVLFAKKINEFLSYTLVDESPESRVVLLSNGETGMKIPATY